MPSFLPFLRLPWIYVFTIPRQPAYIVKSVSAIRDILQSRSSLGLNKRPEFTAWLSEVKQVNLETLPNWEEKQMFKE
ncbi:hypothetical protein B296_00001027 [Ensete ventricosum]|uniref:Uncharacterized protein n=1 Tax=Ensete ventricosum TaxID=4639 RepID=A0A427AZ84_ENSVE|nr:hypothetical protein B296_00001027 [Ensete ventricosum]